MKKIVFLILSVLLCLTFALSGCSCAPDSYLEFENAVTTNVKTETLVYDVSFADDYKGLSCAQPVNKDLLPEYKNGSLIIEFNGSGKPLPDGITQHITFDGISTFNYIRSVLTIDVVVNGKTYNDKIISEVYFYDAEWAFAPVYSKTTVKNTFIAMSTTQIGCDQKVYEYSTIYKNEKYTLNKKYYSPAQGEDINLVDIENLDQTKMKGLVGNGGSHEYEKRKAIDNVQLLFIARNLNLAKGKSSTMPTVTYVYNGPKTLLIKNNSQSSMVLGEINYNGTTLTNVDMPVKNLVIAIDGSDHVGANKYLTLQSEKVGDIENFAFPVEYAESIIENHSYNMIGALVYKLKSVSITKK